MFRIPSGVFSRSASSRSAWTIKSEIAAGLVALVLISVMWMSAFAATGADDDDEMFQIAHRASAGKTRGRAYVGARDEQGLEVQISLAQPSRNPDGTAALPSEDDEPRVDAPETD